MLKTETTKHTLHFRQPAGTSRGIYTERDIWLLKVTDTLTGATGVGECAPLPDLSCDSRPDYGDTLRALCLNLETTGEISIPLLRPYPSILFGMETALLAMQRGDTLFDTPFSRGEEGMPINGLVWMGSYEEMNRRMEEKIEQGFNCVKLKIGAIDFDSELNLVRSIRKRFSPETIELRVDANGGFSPRDALRRIEELSHFGIHSIEQPIKQRQWGLMAEICSLSAIPVALDEELIGVNVTGMKEELLERIKPQYLVLKPSLHGGISGTREWVSLARSRGIGSWITSALEGSVGLSAIAQLASHIYGPRVTFPQGLGTGSLYTDNLPAATEIRGNMIWMKERINTHGING